MYYYNLNLTIEPLVNEVNQPVSLGPRMTNLAEKIELDNINPELISLLSSRDIAVGWVELFHKMPGMGAWEQIHIDEYRGDFAKLNWVYGGLGSRMCWFEELVPGQTQISYNEMGGPYISFQYKDVKLVESTRLLGPCIIQAGVPHNVIMGSEPRHALSMVLLDKTAKVRKRLLMQEAVDRLADLLVPREGIEPPSPRS